MLQIICTEYFYMDPQYADARTKPMDHHEFCLDVPYEEIKVKQKENIAR